MKILFYKYTEHSFCSFANTTDVKYHNDYEPKTFVLQIKYISSIYQGGFENLMVIVEFKELFYCLNVISDRPRNSSTKYRCRILVIDSIDMNKNSTWNLHTKPSHPSTPTQQNSI